MLFYVISTSSVCVTDSKHVYPIYRNDWKYLSYYSDNMFTIMLKIIFIQYIFWWYSWIVKFNWHRPELIISIESIKAIPYEIIYPIMLQSVLRYSWMKNKQACYCVFPDVRTTRPGQLPSLLHYFGHTLCCGLHPDMGHWSTNTKDQR